MTHCHPTASRLNPTELNLVASAVHDLPQSAVLMWVRSVSNCRRRVKLVRYAVVPPNWGEAGDPGFAAELGAAAEESGWDGYFTWDALPLSEAPPPVFDPFVILAAVASATENIRIGTCVLVPARYEPHLLAMRLASLDVLSQGRLTVGVGLGDGSAVFERFGRPGNPKVRAEQLDESLEIITRIWTGERLTHHGKHYTVDGYEASMRPVQTPRIPIWVGGDSKSALRRAARWDGWIGPDNDPTSKSIADLRRVRDALTILGADGSFDIAWAGQLTNRDDLAEGGATWWIEPMLGTSQEVLQRVRNGPPNH